MRSLAGASDLPPVEAGEWPQVYYFTGKDCIVELDTVIGKLSVDHRPSASMGGPSGFFMKNRMVVTIRPRTPVTFESAIDSMYELCCLLSMAAGRIQGIKRVDISTTDTVDDFPLMFQIHQSYKWKSTKVEHLKPSPGDVPLDPIRNRVEFDAVLVDWLSRQRDWRAARGRYLGCLRKSNKYDVERLVAAANMFDILPPSACPIGLELSPALATTRDACSALFRPLSPSPDRSSVLSALGRLGKPSLPKKVAYRVSIVDAKLGSRLPDLQFVANTAVKCRNFYVHGTSGDLDFDKIEPLTHFLTDALEFVFAASDFIEAGWDAERWNSQAGGWGHSFARFKSSYDIALMQLKQATAVQGIV